MSAATGMLTLGLISLAATLCALVPARRIGWLIPVYFLVGWLQGELAIIHLLWQGLFGLYLVHEGALESGNGVLGLLLLLASFTGLVFILRQSFASESTYQQALRTALGSDYEQAIPPERRSLLAMGTSWRDWLFPFAFRRPGVSVVRNLSYGPAGKRNLLDIYRPAVARDGGFPVLLQIHGGGWMIGQKQEQAMPLMYYLAQRGWLCVSINYRLSPADTFPAHIEDVKRAIAWVKTYIREYGGNPDFIAVTGGSAGGHLSSLAALTPNEPDYQPGFEQADTEVQAAVPFYGVFDWLDENNTGHGEYMQGFLAEHVMGVSPEENTQLWDQGRPYARVNKDAPPFMVVHGSHDSLAWVEDARNFVGALRDKSGQPVAYAEIEGAQHGFEIFHSPRCDLAVQGVATFLEWAYADWQAAAVPD